MRRPSRGATHWLVAVGLVLVLLTVPPAAPRSSGRLPSSHPTGSESNGPGLGPVRDGSPPLTPISLNGTPSNTLVGGIDWYGNAPLAPLAAAPSFGYEGGAIQTAVYDWANNALYFSGLRTNLIGVLNGTTLAPITVISQGNGSTAEGSVSLALDNSTQTLFVADLWNHSVTVVNCSDNRVVATISLGSPPEYVAFGPNDAEAYVPNGNGVSVINTTTYRLGTPIRSPNSGQLLTGAAYDPVTRLLYVTDASDRVLPVNVTTNTWAGGNLSFRTSGQFGSLWVDPLTGNLYLSDNLSNYVWVINVSAGDNVTNVSVGEFPMGLALDPLTRMVVVPHWGYTWNLAFLNATTGKLENRSLDVDLGHDSSIAVYDPAREELAVFSDQTELLTLIDARNLTIASVVNLDPQFVAMVPIPSSPLLVLADRTSGSLYLFNRTDQRFLPRVVAGTPNAQQLLYDPVSHAVFSASPAGIDSPNNEAWVSGTYVGNWSPVGPPVATGNGSIRIALGLNGSILVTSCDSGTLDELSPLGAWLPGRSLSLGGCPDDVSVDPSSGTAFVSNLATKSIVRVNLSSFLPEGSPWPVLDAPSAVLFDPLDREIYVGAADSGNLTVSNGTGATIATLTSTPYNRTVALVADSSNGLVYASDPSGFRILSNTTELADLDIRGDLGNAADGYAIVPSPDGTVAYVSTALAMVAFLSDRPEIQPLSVAPSSALAGRTVFFSTAPLEPGISLSFQYSGLPPGCASVDLAAFACRPSTGGTYRVTVNATDRSGDWVESSTTLTVASANLSAVSLAASPPMVDLGQSVTLTARAVGSGPNETFSFVGLPTGCGASQGNVVVCRPTESGAFLVSVSVNDSWGQQANGSALLQVFGLPAITGFDIVPSSISLGGTATFFLGASGGAPGPLRLSASGLPPGCPAPVEVFWSCAPTATGTFDVIATIQDSTGAIASTSANLTVLPAVGPPPAPTILDAYASPNPTALGEAVTVTVVVAGGASPLQYSYQGLPPGCSAKDSSVFTCLPSAVGTFPVNTTVTDARNRSVSTSFAMVVAAAAATAPPRTNPEGVLSPAGIAVAGLLVLGGAGFGGGLAVLLRRGRRPPDRDRSAP